MRHKVIDYASEEGGLAKNVALLHALRLRPSSSSSSSAAAASNCDGPTIIVANVHVLFNPGRGDIKIAQVRVLAAAAAQMRADFDDAPVIMAGDFNCVPDSPLYRFLAEGSSAFINYDRKEMSGQVEGMHVGAGAGRRAASPKPSPRPPKKPPRKAKFDPGPNHWRPEHIATALGHPPEESDNTSISSGGETGGGPVVHLGLEVASAYAAVLGREPDYTSAHRRFVGTVDYVWYGGGGLVPTRVLLPADLEFGFGHAGLPDWNYPSDHQALTIDFAWRRA